MLKGTIFGWQLLPVVGQPTVSMEAWTRKNGLMAKRLVNITAFSGWKTRLVELVKIRRMSWDGKLPHLVDNSYGFLNLKKIVFNKLGPRL